MQRLKSLFSQNLFGAFNGLKPKTYLSSAIFNRSNIRCALHTMENDFVQFDALFPTMVKNVVTIADDFQESSDWLIKVLEHNLLGGKRARALTAVSTYKEMAKEVTSEDLLLAQVVGWCIEMMHASLLVFDDIMDGSDMRRHKPCWHKVNNLENKAINDGLLIESGLFYLIRRYFGKKTYYNDLLDLFLVTKMYTVLGEMVDLHSYDENNRPKLKEFTMDRYIFLTNNKTSYYTAYLPVSCGMYVAGISNPKLHEEAKPILLLIGRYLQMQDDYLDSFVNESKTGKEGRDIIEGKCSWPIVYALKHASPSQKSILEEFYGRDCSDSVTKVKEVYDELKVEEAFLQTEKDLCLRISKSIKKLPKEVSQKPFNDLLQFFRREK